jgi:Flp pilus assembly protein TadD
MDFFFVLLCWTWQLGLDGKYARSAAEAVERQKAKELRKTKKTLEKFKKHETSYIQEFHNVFENNAPVFRVTRDLMEAGKRVVRIADCHGESPETCKVILTQDLSHLESHMPANAFQSTTPKSYPEDAENDVKEPVSSEPKSIYGLIKVFLNNLQNCEVVVKSKIITGTVEIHNCENIVLKIENTATVATVQADLSKNITLEFHDAVSGKNMPGKTPVPWGDDKDDRIFHAGVNNLHIRIFRDGFLECETKCDYIADGATAVGNATPEECQFVTSMSHMDGNSTLVTEKVVRVGSATGSNVRAMTDRELEAERERREKAAKMALAMAEDLVQVKDKEGNILVKKTEPQSEEEKEEEVVEEVHTPGSLADQQVLEECGTLKARGNEAFGAGEYAQAILHYSLCLDKAAELSEKQSFPEDVVYANRAACFLKLGQHEKAEADAAQTISINPKNVKGHFRRGLALHAAGRYEEALPVLANAYKLEPKNKQIEQAIRFAEVRLEEDRRKRMGLK